MNGRDILFAYALPVGLALLVALFANFVGDPPSVIFHKALLTPLYLLAMRGLRQFFPETLDTTRPLAAQIEFLFLQSALLSAFITLALVPHSIESLGLSAFVFFMTTLLGTASNVGLLWLERRKGW